MISFLQKENIWRAFEEENVNQFVLTELLESFVSIYDTLDNKLGIENDLKNV